MFSFNLEITQEMAPEATVIVFYVREQDGDIVYDEFNVELGFTGKNFVCKSLKLFLSFQLIIFDCSSLWKLPNKL